MFAGIEGIARKASGAYIGVDGVARRAKKLYMGVDGKARICWEAEGGTDSPTGVRAYLYNGVKLPELPECDRETYPYAHILRWHNYKDYDNIDDAPDTYIFYATKDPVNYGYSIGAMKYHIDPINGEYQYYRKSYLKTDGVFANPPVWEINSNTNSEDGYTSGELLGILIWSNYQVTSEDGLDCPAPSDPVPLYSYNGVELPELPEWDRDKYPYAYIVNAINWYYVYYLPVPLEAYTRDNGDVVMHCSSDEPFTYYWGAADISTLKNGGTWDEAWSEFLNGRLRELTNKGIDKIGNSVLPLWCNSDLCFEDGTVAFAGSEPQPVYL